ncbi:hypothetical protein O6H91_09G015400 [Diphasiastrum complanatum]|uniref:Uncharacterized protein n=3 Tax=Diphasiastrum complanatum TaxID=34168 RepID=A0ACC2CLI8_DIPCM|nr:hypothetical protein O6H91_09G015400 [Diphasiastrum complanatum]KAJ7542862.1 hypothetical protein O6H91_09G015400 [Diphasiastrum complanatum]KAJ7542863.1 hypothetical protein O6H91_09G015400 [Diphasiastrum complanatum]
MASVVLHSAIAAQIRLDIRVVHTRWRTSKSCKIVMATATPVTLRDTAQGRFLGNSFHSNGKASRTWPSQQQIEIIRSLESWAEEMILPLLKPVEKCWQPHDYLPNFSSDTFMDELLELKRRTFHLPNDYLVCLVGDMITEEALPTYQSFLNTFEGVRDTTVASPTPWNVWIRAWTAEENRHGDLLNKYLYLSGRVDMRMVEKTTQYLVRSGMETHVDSSPYNGFIYTSFQERATFISHANTARFAKEHGDDKLATICGIIASDERRHEIAYTRIVGKLFEVDPNGAVLAFAEMMRKKITMPAHLMFDGENSSLFKDYAAVAQRCNVYTAKDYADIMEHLIATWKIEKISALSTEALQAQQYVCSLPSRMRKLSERAHDQERVKAERESRAFSWIFHKSVKL